MVRRSWWYDSHHEARYGSHVRVGKRDGIRQLLTDYPQIVVDLRALYTFDIFEALESDRSRPTAMALELINRLQWEPMSQYRAEIVGSEEMMGWDRNSTALSAIYNVLATKLKGKKLTEKQQYPVPKANKKKKKFGERNPVRSVKEINWAGMMGGLEDG